MTVGELCERMTNTEFQHWNVYWGRRAQDQELAEKMARHGR